MPATKAQSKQKRTRTLQPKQCAGCYKKCQELLDMAVANEKLEFECDVMMSIMDEALWKTILRYTLLAGWHNFMVGEHVEERQEFERLLQDIQLIQSGCTRELGGSVWIRGEQLAECLNRYTNWRAK